MNRPDDLAAPRLELRTPEHVVIEFELADMGSRGVAVALDLGIQLTFLVVLGFTFGALRLLSDEALPAFLLVAAFVVRNFYFTFSEIRWHGRTLGKRALNLRVVARDGGPLAAELLFARNLTRELETFLPLSALLAPESLVPGAPKWVQATTLLWITLLTLLPLFNRYRARLGDLLAGTAVVHEPKATLLGDLFAESRSIGAVEEFVFTPQQLDVYGIRELQVLEDVLRREASLHREELLQMICEKIKRKIGWERSRGRVQPERFLQAFYAAQRERLEKKMIFGERRDQKVR